MDAGSGVPRDDIIVVMFFTLVGNSSLIVGIVCHRKLRHKRVNIFPGEPGRPGTLELGLGPGLPLNERRNPWFRGPFGEIGVPRAGAGLGKIIGLNGAKSGNPGFGATFPGLNRALSLYRGPR